MPNVRITKNVVCPKQPLINQLLSQPKSHAKVVVIHLALPQNLLILLDTVHLVINAAYLSQQLNHPPQKVHVCPQTVVLHLVNVDKDGNQFQIRFAQIHNTSAVKSLLQQVLSHAKVAVIHHVSALNTTTQRDSAYMEINVVLQTEVQIHLLKNLFIARELVPLTVTQVKRLSPINIVPVVVNVASQKSLNLLLKNPLLSVKVVVTNHVSALNTTTQMATALPDTNVASKKTVTNKPTSGPIVTNGPVVTDGKCGKTKFDFGYNPRIVGGRQAKKGEFPWQVQIQRNGGHYCGGTVLDNQWVLTAAHCMGGPSSQYKFVVGQHDKYANEGTEQIFSASKIIVHENYGNGNMRYDIALIKLNGKVQFNDYARTACMPSHNENFVGETNCIVSGWGALKEGSGGPRILNAVSKPVISNTVCKQAYSGIYDSNICGGFAAGGKDACQGDSGGPYVCKKAGQPWKIVGVVSWGHGCARPGKYGVYASVPFFYNWIKSNQAKY